MKKLIILTALAFALTTGIAFIGTGNQAQACNINDCKCSVNSCNADTQKPHHWTPGLPRLPQA